MRIFTAIIFSLTFSVEAYAGAFECTTVSGMYKPVGESKILSAQERDPDLIGSTFIVVRETGRVVGNTLFSNQDLKITIVRDIDDLINTYEVMSENNKNDIKLLKIDRFEGRFTFKYYFGWLGLLAAGDCSVD